MSGVVGWIRRHRAAAGIVVIAAVLSIRGLGNYHFWSDEAETAVFSQNVLRMGLPYGFDGRNLFENRNGMFLNADLLMVAIPWLQFYVTALAFALFGETYFVSRALFVLAGLGAMVFQYLFVLHFYGRSRLALINLALMAGSTAFLLAGRQCRYYALAMLGASVTLWLYSRFEGRWQQVLATAGALLWLAFAHELMAFAFLAALAMTLFMLDDPRRALRFFLIPLPLVALLVGVFKWWLYRVPAPSYPYLFRNALPEDFLRIFYLYLRDYNSTPLVPVGLVAVLAAAWLIEGCRSRGVTPRLRREGIVPVFLLGFTLITAVFSPQMSTADRSDIRYATVAYPMLLLLSAMAVDRLWQWRRSLGVVALAVTIGTNWLTLERPARYYFAEYLREIAVPFDNSVKWAAGFLGPRAREGETILVLPNNMSPALAFSFRDRLRFCGIVGEDYPHLRAGGLALPAYTYSSAIQPDWIVGFGPAELPHASLHLSKIDFSRYVEHRLPIAGPDTTRPEIFWRTFAPVTNVPPEFCLVIYERADRQRDGGREAP